jgi:hypothetical protein
MVENVVTYLGSFVVRSRARILVHYFILLIFKLVFSDVPQKRVMNKR